MSQTVETENLKGKKALITGASRGLGRAMALGLARAGCDVALISKTLDRHPKLDGSLEDTAKHARDLGANCLILPCDVRDDEQLKKAVERIQTEWGALDFLINNAGSVQLTNTEQTELKRFDLMLGINLRAAFALVQATLPLLKESKSANILSISPPLDLNQKWLAPHLPYTLSKYGLSLSTIGWAGEFKRYEISVNSLWPKTLIDTAAMRLFQGVEIDRDCRSPEIVADAACFLLSQKPLAFTGHHFLDEELLNRAGVTDFSPYQLPGANPKKDLYVE